MNHSPEPWSDNSECLFDRNGKQLIGSEYDGTPGGEPITPNRADLERIVACVNALQGFPTEAVVPFMAVIRSIMPMAGRIDQPDSPAVYLAMACGKLTEAFEILHKAGMEWEQNS